MIHHHVQRLRVIMFRFIHRRPGWTLNIAQGWWTSSLYKVEEWFSWWLNFFITSTTPPLHWINLILSRTICKGTSCIRFYIHCNHLFIITKRRRMCLAFLLVPPLSPARWLHSPLHLKQCSQKSNVYRMLARCTECSLNIPIYTQCSQ